MIWKIIRTQTTAAAHLAPWDFSGPIRDLIDSNRDAYHRILDAWDWGRSNAINSHISAPWSDINFMKTMAELNPDDIPF